VCYNVLIDFGIKNMFNKELEKFDLLKHCFYRAWDEGKLSQSDLQEYACQYFNHVKETPRYLSMIHSRCDDISVRQVILDNLVDEEKGDENHPELWLRFSDSLQVDRKVVKNAKLLPTTKNLNDTFFDLVKKSTAEGLGALYAYERQIPGIAKTKIDSLKKFYQIHDQKDIKFFTVHIEADEWHSEECENLIKKLSSEEQNLAKEASLKLAQSLWGFLDGMEELRLSKSYPNIH
jgi:pyrroloquinoline-quinone synthase